MRPLALFPVLFMLCTCDSNPPNTEADTTPVETRDTEQAGGDVSQDTDPQTEDAEDDADAPPETTLAACTGDATALLSADSMSAPEQNSDVYTAPTSAERTALRACLEALVEGRIEAALEAADAAGYALCEDENGVIAGAPPAASGHARWLLRTGAARPLIVEAPHVNFEVATREEAIAIFEGLNARALIMTGTHRCASSDASSCSGTTGVCSDGVAQAFRRSDMAHVEDSHYHAAHVALSERFSSALVVSLHGFSDDGASVSNGTTDAIADDAPVAQLATALAAETGAYITTCNDYTGATREVRLCGTTNTQGRHVNGSEAPCEMSSETATQRFIHLEQSRTLRETSRAAIVDAFDAVVPQ